MKTTIKGLIKAHLIKVCKEKTVIMRERVEVKPKKQFTKKKAEEVFQKLRIGFTTEVASAVMDALSTLLDAPELSRHVFQLEALGVIVLEKATSGQPYGTSIPLIVTYGSGGSNNRLLYNDGRIDCGVTFTSADEPRPATDTEIKTCIDSLNEKQWAVILHPGTALFAPIVAEAMNSEVELLEINDGNSKEPEDGAEIETNGRRINVGTTKE